MQQSLKELGEDWLRWSSHADKSNDGWESDYPSWDDLMSAAMSAMTSDSYQDGDIAALELCWRISEETEDLADFARKKIDACWNVLLRLVHSQHPQVRWQVYDVLSEAGAKAESILREGLNDTDPYVKRRAILSLARLGPADARHLAQRFANDADPYIRKASLEFLRSDA
jgi:HEAT repeat protein